MRKGIAIQTILLLVIGVLVAGIVIFMVYRYASSSVISEGECQARLSEICTLCKNGNWNTGWPVRGGAGGVDDVFFEVIDDCKTYSKFSSFLACNDPPDTSCHCSTLQNPCKMFGIE